MNVKNQNKTEILIIYLNKVLSKFIGKTYKLPPD